MIFVSFALYSTAALFVEPEILMLDEPTNHLDISSVVWLESYLVTYSHTLLVVSHDRGFLNEVCSDIMEFKRRKLTVRFRLVCLRVPLTQILILTNLFSE